MPSHSIGGEINLCSTNISAGCKEEAVKIVFLHVIWIDERDRVNTNAGQGLSYDGTDATKADDPYMKAGNCVLGSVAPTVKRPPKDVVRRRGRDDGIVMEYPVDVWPDDADLCAAVACHGCTVPNPKAGAPIAVNAHGQTKEGQARGAGCVCKNVALRSYVSGAHGLPTCGRMAVHESKAGISCTCDANGSGQIRRNETCVAIKLCFPRHGEH